MQKYFKNTILIKYILLSISLFLTQLIRGQDIKTDLVTDRPDQTESSFTVPLKSLQIETGFIMEIDKTDLFSQISYAYNSTLLRYGLLENLELRLGIEYMGDKITNRLNDDTYRLAGFSPLYTGFKLKVTEENGLKPEIAFLGGLVLPFTAGNEYKPDYSGANIRFAFSHTLTDRISIGYNLGAEWDGETAIPGYFYSFATGIGISDKLGGFIESYGLILENGYKEHMLDAGFTYLLIQNLQFDLSGGIGINNNAPDSFISFGLSYRIPG